MVQGHLPVDIVDDCVFIEPSAGAGDIFAALPAGRRVGVELDPGMCLKAAKERGFEFLQEDFLNIDEQTLGVTVEGVPKSHRVVIGNPPYVVRDEAGRPTNSIIVAFMSHALRIADTVAFLLPPQCATDSFVSQLPGDYDVKYSAAADDTFTFCDRKVRRKSSFVLARKR